MVAGTGVHDRILPDGNMFGNKEEDEFFVEANGKRFGIFKRFEYLTIPFSITGRQDITQRVLEKARKNGSSFDEELKKDAEASSLATKVLEEMKRKPEFSKQTVDTLLAKAYVHDNLIARMYSSKEALFEENIARVIVAWNKLADFYNIEGLVGGQGDNNPFETNGKGHSVLAGGLDSLEERLPQTLKQLESDFDKKKMLLQLSSITGRSYNQVEQAIKVLGIVFKGKQDELSQDEVQGNKELVDSLSKAVFSKNIEHGKFFNTIIRFHNWMPIALKEDDISGDAYDSVCMPSKKAFEVLITAPEVKESLSKITDATSPKGLGIAAMVDRGTIAGKGAVARRVKSLEKEVDEFISSEIKGYFFLGMNDNLFYPSITGGKWRGLKLLNDAKQALGLKYKVSEGFVMSSFATEKMLEGIGARQVIFKDLLSFGQAEADEAQKRIAGTGSLIGLVPGLEQQIDKLLKNSESGIVVRSSMYGEDGNSNFSGTYNSKCAGNDKREIEDALKTVVSSYFSEEAMKSREDVNLAHIPGIGVIFQKKIEGKGGVIHITSQKASITYAKNPEEAVQGNGIGYTAKDLDELLDKNQTGLTVIKEDLKKLHQIFGDIDLEFVVDNKSDVYLIQMRNKYNIPQSDTPNISQFDKLSIKGIGELATRYLDKDFIVEMEFLGKENLADKEHLIMDFIRNNKKHIKAIVGYMPQVAHIPNKIEGHFRIPYIKKEYAMKKD